MKVTAAKENSERTSFVERRIPPVKLELVWDNWRSRPADGNASYNDMHSLNTIALASSSCENVPSTPLSATKSKRWGFFGSKKAIPESPITPGSSQGESSIRNDLTRKKSKVLKKSRSMGRTKSSADLRYHTSGRNDLGAANSTPSVPNVPATPIECSLSSPEDVDTARFSEATLYFTVDPAWDESKGDAHLYFLPSSSVPHTYGEGSHSTTSKASETPHGMGTTIAHNSKPLKNIKSVVGSDNQTSFLFIE